MKLEFLPAYSLDLNPIELAFSLLKHKLCRYPPPSTSDFEVHEHLYLHTFAINATNSRAFFHQSGHL